MAISQTVIAINVFGGGALERRSRTTSSGTSDRYTASIKSEPILHEMDPIKLGQRPALAIRDLFVAQIEAISEIASEATLLKRKYAESALARGAAWARKRYAGGRTGATTPNQSDRLFNDSHRLADGILVRENKQEGAWTVNVTANRFDPSTFKDGEVGLSRMIDRLVSMVPAMRGDVLSAPAVVQAIAESYADAIFVMRSKALAENRAEWKALASQAYKTLLEPLLLG